MDRVTDFILGFLEERGIDIPDDSVGAVNLSDEGMLDSFGMLTLLMAIEDAFDVRITPMDMLDDDTKTVGGLARLIQRRMNP